MGTAPRGWRRHEVTVRVQTYTPKHAMRPVVVSCCRESGAAKQMASRRRLRLPATAVKYHCGCPLQIENSISLAAGGASALKHLSPVARMPGVGPLADASQPAAVIDPSAPLKPLRSSRSEQRERTLRNCGKAAIRRSSGQFGNFNSRSIAWKRRSLRRGSKLRSSLRFVKSGLRRRIAVSSHLSASAVRPHCA